MGAGDTSLCPSSSVGNLKTINMQFRESLKGTELKGLGLS